MTKSIFQRRRALVRGGMALMSSTLVPRLARAADEIRIGTTPVFLDDQLGFLEAWRLDLQQRLGQPVRFVQRKSYREVTDLLLEGILDCAWLCGYPFVRFHDRLQLVVVPVYRGEPRYQSYLIVPSDQPGGPVDLKRMAGRTFAYSDPLSNSGYLVPRYTLNAEGIDPDRHFRRTLFTWSHRKVVQAVGMGVVDGGAVDGYVWETLNRLHPEQASRTRVAWKSHPYGFPPIVAANTLDRSTLQALRGAFTSMPGDASGARLLARLNLDGFEVRNDQLFSSIRTMMQALIKAGKLT